MNIYTDAEFNNQMRAHAAAAMLRSTADEIVKIGERGKGDGLWLLGMLYRKLVADGLVDADPIASDACLGTDPGLSARPQQASKS